MTLLAIDIGYSNVKICTDQQDAEKTYLFPAGVAPANEVSHAINGQVTSGTLVNVDDERFVAGVEHHQLAGRARVLDANYTRSDDYRALFYAALASLNTDHVKRVVTGLPTYQCQDKERVEQLKIMMRGSHQIADKRKVTVDEVLVVPQPTGAYMDLYMNIEETDALDQGNVLIIDPGYFSVDWVLVSHGMVEDNSSDSSKEAVSVVLEEAAILLATDYGIKPRTIDLEKAIRQNTPVIWLAGRKIEIDIYLVKAVQKAAQNVARKVKTALRQNDCTPDIIVLAGGGAEYYQKAITSEFPQSQVKISEGPVFANVRGYYQLGRQ